MKKITLLITITLLIALTILGIYRFTGFYSKYGFSYGKCIDSDNTSFYLTKDEPSFYIKGNTTYENFNLVYTDYCARGAKIKEYYCDHSSIIRSARRGCPKGCKDGACVR